MLVKVGKTGTWFSRELGFWKFILKYQRYQWYEYQFLFCEYQHSSLILAPKRWIRSGTTKPVSIAEFAPVLVLEQTAAIPASGAQ